MFTIFFGAFALLAALAATFGFYLFSAYVMYRLGDKFRVGSFAGFLLPVYNVMLLCDCAGVTRWLTAGLAAPAFAAAALNLFCLGMFSGNIGYLVSAVFFSAGFISGAASRNGWGRISGCGGY